ncbi:CGNR zinc finger domain-containing protein [Allokutzneria oryzae]|uniref:CGNR zinc finger domain-containing protein n=1 Tax=Allokutzneria oryzae TaxID=1378989 RepID=A0ABV6A1X3_9PSEU
MGARSAAPNALEQVRKFLNTWRIPNDTRVVTDLLPELIKDDGAWQDELPGVTGPRTLPELTRLREELRGALGQARPDLAELLRQHPVVAVIGSEEAGQPPITHVPLRAGAAGVLTGVVVDALALGLWDRLKACPDCKWVFYDHSRNGSRTWCGMYAESPQGRACGSIAKMRAYRARK